MGERGWPHNTDHAARKAALAADARRDGETRQTRQAGKDRQTGQIEQFRAAERLMVYFLAAAGGCF